MDIRFSGNPRSIPKCARKPSRFKNFFFNGYKIRSVNCSGRSPGLPVGLTPRAAAPRYFDSPAAKEQAPPNGRFSHRDSTRTRAQVKGEALRGIEEIKLYTACSCLEG